MSKRVEFTTTDDSYLTKFLAIHNPTKEGRMGNTVYKLLEENPDGKWPWSTRHSWSSWRERYKNNEARFNHKIRVYQKKKGIEEEQPRISLRAPTVKMKQRVVPDDDNDNPTNEDNPKTRPKRKRTSQSGEKEQRRKKTKVREPTEESEPEPLPPPPSSDYQGDIFTDTKDEDEEMVEDMIETSERDLPPSSQYPSSQGTRSPIDAYPELLENPALPEPTPSLPIPSPSAQNPPILANPRRFDKPLPPLKRNGSRRQTEDPFSPWESPKAGEVSSDDELTQRRRRWRHQPAKSVEGAFSTHIREFTSPGLSDTASTPRKVDESSVSRDFGRLSTSKGQIEPMATSSPPRSRTVPGSDDMDVSESHQDKIQRFKRELAAASGEYRRSVTGTPRAKASQHHAFSQPTQTVDTRHSPALASPSRRSMVPDSPIKGLVQSEIRRTGEEATTSILRTVAALPDLRGELRPSSSRMTPAPQYRNPFESDTTAVHSHRDSEASERGSRLSAGSSMLSREELRAQLMRSHRSRLSLDGSEAPSRTSSEARSSVGSSREARSPTIPSREELREMIRQKRASRGPSTNDGKSSSKSDASRPALTISERPMSPTEAMNIVWAARQQRLREKPEARIEELQQPKQEPDEHVLHKSSPGVRFEEPRRSATPSRVAIEPKLPQSQLLLPSPRIVPGAQMASRSNSPLDAHTTSHSANTLTRRTPVEDNLRRRTFTGYPDQIRKTPKIDFSVRPPGRHIRQSDPTFSKPIRRESSSSTVASSTRSFAPSSRRASLLPLLSTTSSNDSSTSLIPDFPLSESDQANIIQQGIQTIIEKLSTAHGFQQSVTWNVYRHTKDLPMTEEVLKEMNRSANNAGVDTIQKFVGRVQRARETQEDHSYQDDQDAGSASWNMDVLSRRRSGGSSRSLNWKPAEDDSDYSPNKSTRAAEFVRLGEQGRLDEALARELKRASYPAKTSNRFSSSSGALP